MPGNEHDIATYLTLDGHTFLAPQYNVAYNRELNEGGSCPDFVALDLKRREVIIVEVTAASNLKPLFIRIRERKTRWYKPIWRKMGETGFLDDGWKPMRFLGFIRQANVALAQDTFKSEHDVAFWAIEEATFPWSYWDERMAKGLPR